MDFNELRLQASGDFVKHVLVGCDNLFGPWLAHRIGGDWFPGRGSTIGLMDDKKGPVACCLFEGCNGASVMVHIASEGQNWVNREFLWFISYYPFKQLGVTKVLAPIESTNTASIRWTEHFGFKLEATLKDAAPKGDLLIYSLVESDCKWLHMRKKPSETKSTSSS